MRSERDPRAAVVTNGRSGCAVARTGRVEHAGGRRAAEVATIGVGTGPTSPDLAKRKKDILVVK